MWNFGLFALEFNAKIVVYLGLVEVYKHSFVTKKVTISIETEE